MAKDPRAGELTTPNLGLTKPTVGASIDQWGGYINGDLDLIDTAVHNVQTSVPAASTTTPAMDGTAAVGTGTTWARADHVHPTDVHAIGDNRIINGDMRIDQRNNGALVTVGGYTIDRWAIAIAPAGKFSAQRVTSVAMTANGFPYALNFTSSSAYSPAAADSFFAAQAIEADMVSDFAWGTAGAQPVTLSFWVNVSAAGTYSGAITNNPAPPTRSYPFSFTVPLGWQKVAITIPGDTAGTWVMSGNAAGVSIRFDLGSGSQFRGTAGSWQNGNFNGATGAASIVATNGAVMQITGVKLEIGSVATPYNRQSLAKSMADCQRYFQVIKASARFPAAAAGNVMDVAVNFLSMRAVPTVTAGAADGNVNISAANLNTVPNMPNSARFEITSTAAGDAYGLGYVFQLVAEL